KAGLMLPWVSLAHFGRQPVRLSIISIDLPPRCAIIRATVALIGIHPLDFMPTSTPLNSVYDLAKKTGVSVSTVSRVMNQRGRISLETRQRVLAAARAAGFRPRMAARQITVAVVLDR